VLGDLLAAAPVLKAYELSVNVFGKPDLDTGAG
jgi:hypothetical protein